MERTIKDERWEGARPAAGRGTARTVPAVPGIGGAEGNGRRRSAVGSNRRPLFPAVLLSLLLVLGAGQARATYLYDGLVAYWPFSGDALDATGNGHDATVHGAALATDRFGNANSAYDFSGGDYLSVAPDSQLQITGPLTLNAWIKYRSLPLNPRVFSFGPDLKGYELWVGGGAFGTTPNQPVFFFGNKGVGSSILLSPGGWHMLTAVGIPGPGGGMELWVDGVLAGTVSGGPTVFSYPGQLNIGRKASCCFDPWNGLIDDAMIYSRALTAKEIQALYALTETLPPPPPKLTVSEPGTLPLLAGALVAFGITGVMPRRCRHRWEG